MHLSMREMFRIRAIVPKTQSERKFAEDRASPVFLFWKKLVSDRRLHASLLGVIRKLHEHRHPTNPARIHPFPPPMQPALLPHGEPFGRAALPQRGNRQGPLPKVRGRMPHRGIFSHQRNCPEDNLPQLQGIGSVDQESQRPVVCPPEDPGCRSKAGPLRLSAGSKGYRQSGQSSHLSLIHISEPTRRM